MRRKREKRKERGGRDEEGGRYKKGQESLLGSGKEEARVAKAFFLLLRFFLLSILLLLYEISHALADKIPSRLRQEGDRKKRESRRETSRIWKSSSSTNARIFRETGQRLCILKYTEILEA